MRTHVAFLFLGLVLLATCLTPARATDYFVNGTATSSGDGSEWSEAFMTIGEATILAGAGDRIFVAGREEPSPLIYTEAITVESAVEVVGGYAPTGDPAITDNDPGRYVTIIDGEDTEGEVVTVVDDASDQTVIDGFTITRGVNHGIKNGEASGCLFRNLKLISNGSGTSSGAGINCGPNGSFADIRDCQFESNHGGNGGAIYCAGSSNVRATRCRFIGNAASSGGAIYIETPVTHDFSEILHKPLPAANAGGFTKNQLRHCVFINNEATDGHGGAIYFYEELYAIGCQFVANTADSNGGAIVCIVGSLLGVNLHFRDNHALGGNGGGIHIDRGCWFTLVNTLAHDNEASSFGGFISANALVRGSLVNVTSAANTAFAYPTMSLEFTVDGYCNNGDQDPYFPVDLYMRNCIMADDDGDPWPAALNSIIDVEYSNVTGFDFTGGGHNLQADPDFVNPDNGDFHLKDCSPCIDAADTRVVSQDFADTDGDGRTACSGCEEESNGEFTPDLDFRRRVRDLDSATDTGEVVDPDECPLECDVVVDMGAYEFAHTCLALGDLNLDGNINGLDIQPFTDCATRLGWGQPDTCAVTSTLTAELISMTCRALSNCC